MIEGKGKVKPMSVAFDAHQQEAIDRCARELGISRSAFLRLLVQIALPAFDAARDDVEGQARIEFAKAATGGRRALR